MDETQTEFRKAEYTALRAEIIHLSLLGHQTERNGVLTIAALYSLLFAAEIATPLAWFLPPIVALYVFFRGLHYYSGMRDIGRFIMIQHELVHFPNVEIQNQIRLQESKKPLGWETFTRFFDRESLSIVMAGPTVENSFRKLVVSMFSWFWISVVVLTTIIAFTKFFVPLKSMTA